MSSYITELSELQFSDLVDIKNFSTILENFFQVTGIPNGLVDPDGTILSQAGWMDACTKFHRSNPISNDACKASNISLMSDSNEHQACSSLCKNGLINYATPIIIEEHQLATLFLGQILHSEPDLNFFRSQAEKFNYDEEAYINSILKIPVIDKKTIQPLIDCLVNMAKVLIENGLANYRQKSLEYRQLQLEDILDSSPVATGWADASGKLHYLSNQFINLFGYTLEEIPTIEHWLQLSFLNTPYRNTEIKPWLDNVLQTRCNSTELESLEISANCKDGVLRRMLMNISWASDRLLISFTDITKHWQSEQRNLVRDKLLKMVATAAPIDETLTALIQQIETESKDAICSVVLLDKDSKCLYNPIAPNLPDFYNNAIDGVKIGVGVGSCGTAAYLGTRVIVDNISTHEYWKDYHQLAEQAGLQSCWSEPIISSSDEVLGTFAIYHAYPCGPSPAEIESITFAANLASIAIENQYTQNELKRQAYFDDLTGLANRRHFIEQAQNEITRSCRYKETLSIIMMDIDNFKKVNDTYGHKIGDRVLEALASVSLTTLRSIDIIGRIGGEEFAILLPNTDIERAEEVAERLRANLAEYQLTINANSIVKFTVSLGVTSYNSNEDISLDSLLHQADQALYQAKNEGRNRIVTYTALMSGDAYENF